jgi:hypothetical protein
MKLITDIEQGSYEWKELRHGKIGGSSAKDLFVKELVNSAIFHTICAEKCEPFYDTDEYINSDMQRGIDLEPHAREELERIIGIKFNVPAWIQSDIDILGISPDGLSECEKFACEIKCPTAKKYNAYLFGTALMLADYCYQIATYFAVNPKLEKLYMVAYRPEHRYKTMIIVEVIKETTINVGTEKTPKMETVESIALSIQSNAVLLDVITDDFINTIKF